jgi:hypothetical protein
MAWRMVVHCKLFGDNALLADRLNFQLCHKATQNRHHCVAGLVRAVF